MPLARWIANCRQSLLQGNSAMFLALFTDDASFQMSPFEAPLRGPDMRKAMDEFRARQNDGEWSVEVWSDKDDTAILHWSTPDAACAERTMLGDGVLILRFGSNGSCKQARQWHHWHLAGAPPCTGFVENPACPVK